ncbi:hypothetical protein [Pseudomonas sp. GM79]|uniref:hypothetical protein n=1 Tax=Pseudomonas sp. GM79 TaxID=1144338 RepID=UPI000519988C|nr:hypothetical protein [Pseudomonas sp. GM79]
MFNLGAFEKAIARSKAKQQVQVSKPNTVVDKPPHVATTISIMPHQDEHEQYRQTIITKAIAHIRFKRNEC